MFRFKVSFLIGLGVLFLGLSFFSSPSFSQSSARDDVEFVEHEGHDSEELENVLDDYRSKNSELVDMVQEMNKDGSISPEDQAKLLNMYGKGKGQSKFSQKEMLKNLEPSIKRLSRHYNSMPFDQAKKELTSSVSQTPAKFIIKIFPKFMTFFTNMVRSDNALLKLMSMLKDKDKLMKFLFVNIAIFILGIFILRKKPGMSIMERMSRWLLKRGIITGLRISVLIFFFSNELAPTWAIAMNSFF